MENVGTKLHDDWMGNVAGIPKSPFSVGVGCRVFHIPGMNGLGQIKQFLNYRLMSVDRQRE